MILVILFDVFVDEKTGGYWYFWKGIDLTNVLVYTLLVPPVNVIFLNCYPFNASKLKRLRYFIGWVIFILIYELLALLPQPWGYFYY
ncbi:cytosine/uracil/thiamine/allantoin permease [Neobacillus ginsengisoli]|uniref:Cytosine/uracil/thiamine/allantoin permease n=1 Tax=Neobacillus ginsengisoli TaxID=904295 RepID=A0ABT9XZ17_9BACI|nr:cytosine/uracil/thiamine/allantoin permease [Neobacillus ginsengisoli]